MEYRWKRISELYFKGGRHHRPPCFKYIPRRARGKLRAFFAMNRTEAREAAVKLCFEISAKECTAKEVLDRFFDSEYYALLSEEDDTMGSYPDEIQREYIQELVGGIYEHSAELDGYVAKFAKGWKFGRISRTALAVMKTAMYEIMYMPDIPTGVAVNEAVEIAKHYDEPETVSFINGVLGSFVREEMKEI